MPFRVAGYGYVSKRGDGYRVHPSPMQRVL